MSAWTSQYSSLRPRIGLREQLPGELYKLLGVKRKMSTVFHPQTDGQTERLNCEINQYLRTYVSD